MTRWTENNTEGFTKTELDTLNAAQTELEAHFPAADAGNIADMLTNAWVSDATADTLVFQIKTRLG